MTSIPGAADCNQILYNLLQANADQNSVRVLAPSNVSVFLDEHNVKAVTLQQIKDPGWGPTDPTGNIIDTYRTT